MASKGQNEMYIMEVETNRGYTTAHSYLHEAQMLLMAQPEAVASISHWRKDARNDWELLDRFSLNSSTVPLPTSTAPE